MARFRPHPAQMALALAAVSNTILPLSGCAAASQSGGRTSTPSLALAHAPSSFDAAMRSLIEEPSAPLHAVSAITLNALQAYYARTEYAPLWVDANGLTTRGAALAKARDAGASGLQPVIAAIDERRAEDTPMAYAELEILLSGAPLDAAVDSTDPTVSAPSAELLPAAEAAPDMSRFLRERLPPDARRRIAGGINEVSGGRFGARHASWD
jgi:hypothetical protein